MNHASAKIWNRKQRAALECNADHSENLEGKSRTLIYRKNTNQDAGWWTVRQELGRRPSGSPIRKYQRLGSADDFAAANDHDILSYEQAVDKARGFDGIALQAAKDAYTTDKAVAAYAKFTGEDGTKQARNQEKDAAQLRRHFLGLDTDGEIIEGFAHLRGIAVAALTKDQLKAWRDSLVQRGLAHSSVLRIWTGAHSCLEQAADIDANKIKERPWTKLPKLGQKSSSARRDIRFTRPQALQILANAHEIDPAGATYLEGLYHTGCRPAHELWQLTVGDYDVANEQLTLKECTDETIAKTGRRKVELDTQAGVEFFNKLVAGRPADAPLFVKEDGDSWLVGHHSRRFSDLLKKAGAPKGAVPYSFRHTYISQNLLEGAATSLVAKQCGTSIWMIEQNYFGCYGDDIKKGLRNKRNRPLQLVVNNDEAVAA